MGRSPKPAGEQEAGGGRATLEERPTGEERQRTDYYAKLFNTS